MKDKMKLSEYHLQIGTDDIINRHLAPILADDPEKAAQKLMEVLKEMRVRIGTLLKTDNVSFLFGAGASISADGFSLANIPKRIEEDLLRKVNEEQIKKKKEKDKDEVPSWIELFYRTVSAIKKTSFSFEDRKRLFEPESESDYNEIPINLEDYLSHLHMWLAGMGVTGNSMVLSFSDASECNIDKSDLDRLIKEITRSLSALLDLPNPDKDDALKSHRRFIKKVLTRPLNLRRANLFTLNYDTLLEQAADAEGAVLVDGFVGTLRRVFRPESYDLDFYFPAQTTEGRVHRFDRALHLYKLHGSITWHRCDQNWENPYGLYATFFNQDCQEDDVLIYPSPLKYGQALGLPYSELFRRFGNAIVQPQSVLFTMGYGFGDEHVNALIRQALAIPSFTLVIVDPDPNNYFVSELEALEDERVWIVKGWDLGTFENFVQKLLPDLREEEIYAKVMSTFMALTPPVKTDPNEEDVRNGE